MEAQRDRNSTWWVLACVALVATLGCSSDGDDPGSAVDVEDMTTTSLVAADDDPEECRTLAASAALSRLRDDVRAVLVDGDARAIDDAVGDLTDLGARLPAAGTAALALDAWAQDPTSETTTNAVADAFSSLDREVQGLCSFSDA